MNSSDQHPKLPAWIFIATDLALIGAAITIAILSPHPLSGGAILWIVTCVGLGAIVGLVPIVVYYERQKNETLDERQRALEALARTVSSSAEQISIAANGLHEIAELALKNLRMAEHLPQKLQEKIAEFQAHLSAAAEAENEELERELLALRTTESERLEAVAQRIAKSSTEWARLEAATHQHLTAANEAAGRLAAGTASAINNAQAAAEQALNQARIEAARALGETSGKATRAVETARAAALAEFDAKLATTTALIVDRVVHELSARLGAAGTAGVPGMSSPPPAISVPTPEPISNESPQPAAKRPRRMRREDAGPGAPPPETATEAGANPPPDVVATGADSNPLTEAAHAAVVEPPPVPVTAIPEITPIAPSTAEPFAGKIVTTLNGGASSPPSEPAADVAAERDLARSSRKRALKKAENDEPGLGLDLDDSAGAASGRHAERGLTSDGATRLLVTAYIGIGNRLFIRGDGPGLSWEKGVPLQFVSIGKWRWETNDATAPVQFKLYKNDDLECAALGAQSLDPGYQQEVTAAF